MAGTKEIKKRIGSVKNIRKITKTMEMVAAAKSRRMINRVQAAKPYGDKLQEILEGLEDLTGNIDSPLLRRSENPKKYVLLVVTANRGLCGGYNSNTLKLARRRILELENQGKEVSVHVIGKKGVSYFNFLKQPVARTILDIDDTVTFEQARDLADGYRAEFEEEKFDVLELVSTVYRNAASQVPAVNQILPVGVSQKEEEQEKKPKAGQDIIFEPEPEVILENLLPHLVRTFLFRALLEAVTAEQIYRRVAMKAASDAAGDMSKSLSQLYNRKRQASITQEISEIVGGADAIA